MAFTGKENHDFPLETAVEWTANYRKANPNELKAHFFGKDAIQAILDQADCVGIRLYYALDTFGEKQIIVVGSTAEETDLYNGLLADRSLPCPPLCDSSSPLAN